MNAELKGLIEKWRKGKVKAGTSDMQLHGGRWTATLCADELEALLAAVPQVAAPPTTLTFKQWWQASGTETLGSAEDVALAAWQAASALSEGGGAPRDIEWEQKVLSFAREHGEPWSIYAAMENWKERCEKAREKALEEARGIALERTTLFHSMSETERTRRSEAEIIASQIASASQKEGASVANGERRSE
jgi:hypothetical protein